MKYLLSYIFIGICLLSCHPLGRVQEHADRLIKEYKSLPDYETLPVRVLSWNQALLLVQHNNVELRQAYNNLEEARYQEKKIWREWIPSVNFGQYYNRKLFPGAKGNLPNDAQWSYNVIFNFPSVMELPIRQYTSSLAVFKAQKDIELKQRELTAKLYQLFLTSEFREREKRLRLGEYECSIHETEFSCEIEREEWLQISSLLNDYSARWHFVYTDEPRVTPEDYREAMQSPSELTIIQMALQVEASRLQKLGVFMQFWPQIHVDFYSPTLFNSSGGQLSGFMKKGKDTRVNMDIYVALDTQGQTMQAHRTAKANHELLLNELRKRMWEHKEKTEALIASWRQYEAWKLAMTAYLRFRTEQGAENPEELLRMHADSLQLRQEMSEHERSNIERVCSLVQEYGMPPNSGD